MVINPHCNDDRRRTSQTRRVLDFVSVVALWIALGIVLDLIANAYLLLGIPLTAGFQWGGVRRQLRQALGARCEAPPGLLQRAGRWQRYY